MCVCVSTYVSIYLSKSSIATVFRPYDPSPVLPATVAEVIYICLL